MAKIATGLVAAYALGEMAEPTHVRESVYLRSDGRFQFLGHGGPGSEYGLDVRAHNGARMKRAAGIATHYLTEEEVESWLDRRGLTPLIPVGNEATAAYERERAAMFARLRNFQTTYDAKPRVAW